MKMTLNMKIPSNMKMTSNLKAKQIYQSKHTQPTIRNLPNQTHQIKPTNSTKKAVQIKFFCAYPYFLNMLKM